MPSTHHAHTSAIALKGKSTRILRSASKISANDLVESFSKMKIKERRAKIVKATPKAPQAPQPMEATSHIPVPTQTQSPMNDRSTQIDVEKLADRISSLTISKPTRRAAKRPAAPAHPYGRPTQTKTEKILHSHGMVKRGAVSTFLFQKYLPDALFSAQPTNPARANGPPTKLNNATISLLSNSPPCPEAFNSAFNWSTAWLSSGSATLTPASPNTIEAELYAPPAINLSNDDWLTQVVVTVTSVVKKEVPRPTGKTTKPRITTVRFSLIFLACNLILS
jgi:hypothetical protein